MQEGTAQCVWKEEKALSATAEQERKYSSCNVLCTVLGVHFPNNVICDVTEMPEKGLCLSWVDLQCENWILHYSENSRVCLSLSIHPVCYCGQGKRRGLTSWACAAGFCLVSGGQHFVHFPGANSQIQLLHPDLTVLAEHCSVLFAPVSVTGLVPMVLNFFAFQL